MTLAELITPGRIVPEMQALEHWPAIVELIDHLIAAGDLPESGREEVLAALREREDQCSTGIGSGLAIPHVYSDDIDEITAVFGRSSEGIDFCSLDSNPVHFVVLVIVPREQYNAHLRTLAAIARTLNNSGIRRKLAEAGDSRDIFSILQSRCAAA